MPTKILIHRPITDAQFKAAKRILDGGPRKRGKYVHPVNIELHPARQMVTWTCPQCGERNAHTNTGRGSYFCGKCGTDTDLKINR